MQRQKTPPGACRRCGRPGEPAAPVAHVGELEYEGRKYRLRVGDLPALRCATCRSVVLGPAAHARLRQALRERLHLLAPQTIRDNRSRLGLTQRELAAHLGIARETIARWEQDVQVQQRSLDRLLRLYFEFPVVQRALASRRGLRKLGLAARRLAKSSFAEREHVLALEQQAEEARREMESARARMMFAISRRLTLQTARKEPGEALRLLAAARYVAEADSGVPLEMLGLDAEETD